MEDDQLFPKEKKLTKNTNPPNFRVKFFKDQKNIRNINCFSDEGPGWKKTQITFEKNLLKLNFIDKFKFRRGRVNCSLNDEAGWRWLGIQFSIEN